MVEECITEEKLVTANSVQLRAYRLSLHGYYHEAYFVERWFRVLLERKKITGLLGRSQTLAASSILVDRH